MTIAPNIHQTIVEVMGARRHGQGRETLASWKYCKVFCAANVV